MFNKIKISKKKTNPKGGINFVINQMEKMKIPQIIDKHLGRRVAQAKYSYSQVLMGWSYLNLCGAKRLEHAHKIKKELAGTPKIRLASPDRIADIMKRFATQKTTIKQPSNAIHEFCINTPLVELMLDVALALGMVDGETLDYDNTIIETEKYDSKWTYKKCKGYQPGVCMINKTIVGVEARNGNSLASFKMRETLERSLSLLESKSIHIKNFRSDSASYQYEVIELMKEKKIDFFIRANRSKGLDAMAGTLNNWQEIYIKGKSWEVEEIEYIPFEQKSVSKKSYRLIIRREACSKKKYKYYYIMTSNREMSTKEAITFYNNRGASENNFNELKNGFNWQRLPFSNMNENLVFLILSAMSKNIYAYLIKYFSDKLDWLKSTITFMTFLKKFIEVNAYWDSEGVLNLEETEYNFEKIFS